MQQHIQFNQLPAAASSASRMGHHIKEVSNSLMHNGYACMHDVHTYIRCGSGELIVTLHQRAGASSQYAGMVSKYTTKEVGTIQRVRRCIHLGEIDQPSGARFAGNPN